jgi:hypothetical protein
MPGWPIISWYMDRATYERTITILHQALHRAKVERSEKVRALKRLAQFEQTGPIQP